MSFYALFTQISKKISARNIYTVACLASLIITSPIRARKKIAPTIPYTSAQDLAQNLKSALGPNKDRFLFGASTSEHQCSKQCTPVICDWARFARRNNLVEPHDPKYPCDFWNNYETYIKQLKEKLQINSMRFSIEWPLVQPNGPNLYDQKTLDHYASVFIYMIEHDITPIVCFHHYTSPCWFADLNGFEHRSNSQYFANYCAHTYERIMTAVINKISNDQNFATCWNIMHTQTKDPLWATFNSAEGVAFKGYWTMEAPPAIAEKRALSLVNKVLKNMLEGHVRAYQQINEKYTQLASTITQTKSIPNIAKPKIGFLKNIVQLDGAKTKAIHRICSTLTHAARTVGNNLQNECIYNFFTTGTFDATNMSTIFNTTGVIKPYTNKNAPYALDWIGLNYYSNQIMHLGKKIEETEPNLQTDNANYRIYPYGLYRAIHEINERIAQPVGMLKNNDQSPIPIYVTENGIATTDHEKRNRFYREYLTMLTHAVQEGLPVYGYLTWTAFDNYEWPKTAHSHNNQSDNRIYGLTSVSPDGITLTVKDGATYYQDLIYDFMRT